MKQKEAEKIDTIKRIEQRISELTVLQKHIEIIHQLKPVCEKYKQSNNKERFLRGHEHEIILFETAQRELRKQNIHPIPSLSNIQLGLNDLQNKRDIVYVDYRAVKKEFKELEIIIKNVDAILEMPTESPEKTLDISK